MTTLELADALDADADLCYAEAGNWNVCALEWNAAKELRRLYGVNAELLEALKAINKCCPYIDDGEDTAVLIALGTKDEVRAMRAAIAKAEGETA